MDSFAQVRIVLRTERERGVPFDQAWYRALRQILPPEECPDELKADHEENKVVLADTKPWWRANYEGDRPTDEERERVAKREAKRNADLEVPADEPELIAA